MTAPYAKFDEWEMNATLFQDTIFIEENHSKKLASRQDQYTTGAARGNMSQDLMSFWGYKFETLCLLPAPWSEVSREYIETREDQVVSNYAQYCSIVRTGFGKTKMVIGGEVDAVLDFKPVDKARPLIGSSSKLQQKWSTTKTMSSSNGSFSNSGPNHSCLACPRSSSATDHNKEYCCISRRWTPKQFPKRSNDRASACGMDRYVSTLHPASSNVGMLNVSLTTLTFAGLKKTIDSEGVWRIRKRGEGILVGGLQS